MNCLPRLIALATAFAALTACRLPARISPSGADGTGLQRYTFEQPQMGLPFRMVLFANSQQQAETASTAAFKRIAELNSILSDYEDASELTLLSKSSGSGRTIPTSPELWKILSESARYSRQTDGAFDITVGPFVQLWKRARRERQLPPAEKLKEAATRVGYQHIELDSSRRTARLKVPGMRLDPGAIAKGYAADEALRVLREHGIRSALVSGGGDMSVGDPPPGQPGWRIELAPPDITNAPPARFVSIRNQGLATSGDLFQRFEFGGVRYSHIVNPKTGIGLTDHSLVVVIAPTGIAADALSTSVSVLGPRNGLDLIEKTSGCSASITRIEGNKLSSADSRRFAKQLVSGAGYSVTP